MLSQADKKEIDKIIKRYKKIFDALAAIDNRVYKRSMIINNKPHPL